MHVCLYVCMSVCLYVGMCVCMDGWMDGYEDTHLYITDVIINQTHVFCSTRIQPGPQTTTHRRLSHLAPRVTCARVYTHGVWQMRKGYPLVNGYTVENHPFGWVNQLFLWPFSVTMLVYQRVSRMANIPIDHLRLLKQGIQDGQ